MSVRRSMFVVSVDESAGYVVLTDAISNNFVVCVIVKEIDRSILLN